MSEPGPDRNGRLTYADYAALPDDGRRYQLLEGELVVTPSPAWEHQEIVIELVTRLAAFVKARRLGKVFVAPLDVIFDDHTVVQPDILVMAPGTEPRPDETHVLRPPSLCVEVLSPGTARIDRVRKLDLYARRGVAHYWIVDPESRSIEEYELAGDVYRPRTVTGGEDVFRPVAFPGFEFRLADIGLQAGEQG